jgi:hypothetical protein
MSDMRAYFVPNQPPTVLLSTLFCGTAHWDAAGCPHRALGGTACGDAHEGGAASRASRRRGAQGRWCIPYTPKCCPRTYAFTRGATDPHGHVPEFENEKGDGLIVQHAITFAFATCLARRIHRGGAVEGGKAARAGSIRRGTEAGPVEALERFDGRRCGVHPRTKPG